ncbi:MAG TPA: PPC domain-containing DNA-binding protein [Candidatus Marinimicrobia bacterium]|nr:DNA-binding protein [Candidatus Neomarinimicrobiota bacterium]HJM83872.1 PPC domain-containing DNA-binding protein [Candidatus Neomarinimicrobiota bacterium]
MKFRIDKSRAYMTLAKGDNINKTFESFAEVKGIGCAWLNGIGALENPEIGYYSLEDKAYHRKTFKGEYELTSLIGNITLKEGKPFSHTHITFSDTEFRVFGGHLFNANITAAGEFIMQFGSDEINREMNAEIGLPLWCLEESLG